MIPSHNPILNLTNPGKFRTVQLLGQNAYEHITWKDRIQRLREEEPAKTHSNRSQSLSSPS